MKSIFKTIKRVALVTQLVLCCESISTTNIYLDSSFGPNNDGIVTQTINNFSSISGVAIDSNQYIVFGGTSRNSQRQLLAGRYTSTGIPDPTYGTNGITLTSVGFNADGFAAAIQSDNKLVVAGSVDSGSSGIVIARYTTSGVLDATFGTGGIVTTIIGTQAEALTCLIQPADQKIVVAGYTISGGSTQLFVARYTTAGVLDTGFGTGGIATLLVGTTSVAHAIGLQSTGNIVVGGYATVSGITQYCVARFTSSGILDTSFNTVGYTTTQVPGSTQDMIFGIGIKSDDTIVASGTSQSNGVSFRSAAGYTSNGLLNTSFGVNGFIPNDIGTYSGSTGILIQPDQKAVIAGYASSLLATCRYSATGTVDSTFGNNGCVLTSFQSGAINNSLARQSDGKIVGGGATENQILLIRYNASNAYSVTIINPANGSTISSFPLTINGLASEAGASIRITINGQLIETLITDGNGDWSSLISLLSNGSHTLTAELLSSTQTVLASSSVSFTVSVPDSITITSPFNGELVTQSNPIITGFASTAFAQVKILIDGVYQGTVTTDQIGFWEYPASINSNGVHTVTAQLMSGVNTVASGSSTFTLSAIFGATGATGPIGAIGPIGATGATGPTGATGSDFTAIDYAFAYHTGTDTVSIANTFQPIAFTTLAIANGWNKDLSGNFSNSNSGSSGTYLVQWVITPQPTSATIPVSCTGELFLNGSAITGTAMHSDLNATNVCSALIGSSIVNYTAGNNLQLQWTANNSNTALSTSGSAATNTSAQITIQRLN